MLRLVLGKKSIFLDPKFLNSSSGLLSCPPHTGAYFSGSSVPKPPIISAASLSLDSFSRLLKARGSPPSARVPPF